MPPALSASHPLIVLFTFAFGATVGSFLNVCIYRMPLKQSVSSPTWSYCFSCGERLRFWDLIPLGKPKAINLQTGKPFWVQAAEHGIKSAVLEAPVAFPARELQADSLLLSGLTTPDLRGTQGTEWGLLMAASMLMVIPALALFFVAQRFFIQGITLTGMKA